MYTFTDSTCYLILAETTHVGLKQQNTNLVEIQTFEQHAFMEMGVGGKQYTCSGVFCLACWGTKWRVEWKMHETGWYSYRTDDQLIKYVQTSTVW